MNKRQKNAFIVILAIFLFAGYAAYAFQNEPDGFRGIKWGTNISELSKMKLIDDDGNAKCYARKNDKMRIGDANLDAIMYGFYKNRFSAVGVMYHSSSNFSAIKETLLQQYGEARHPNGFMEEYFWYGSRVNVFLKFNQIQGAGQLWYLYKPLQEEKERDEKEKAKEGARDL